MRARLVVRLQTIFFNFLGKLDRRRPYEICEQGFGVHEEPGRILHVNRNF